MGAGPVRRGRHEVQARFFRVDGALRPDAVKALTRDISTLLVPSSARALRLDRAYLGLVKAQRFERGRDVVVGTAPHVRKRLEQDAETGIAEAVSPAWVRPERTASR